MHPERAEIVNRMKWLVPTGIVLLIVGLAVLWIGYFRTAAAEDDSRESTQRYVWLTMAIVMTVAGPPILYVAVRNFVHLVKHGIEVEGRVVSISPLSKGQGTPVT